MSNHSTPPTPFCSVSFRDAVGDRWIANVAAWSAFEAAARALDFWADPYWKGPQPAADAVLEVSPMGRATVWVRVARVREAVEAERAFIELFEPRACGERELAELVAAVFSDAPMVWV